jgi:hypothetical protein
MINIGSPIENDTKRNIVAGILSLIVLISLYSYISALYGFISPMSELRWNSEILSISASTFNPGDNVVVDVMLEEGNTYFSRGNYYYFLSGENIRWIVNVMDPNNSPVFLESNPINGAIGDQAVGLVDFDLPTNASPGTYTVKVIVWSAWLPGGETRTNIIDDVTFEVVT